MKSEDDEDDHFKNVNYLPNELGHHIQPLHYDLHLFLPAIDGTEIVFEGYVGLTIIIKKETNSIALHADPSFLHIRFAAIHPLQFPKELVIISDYRIGLGLEGHITEFHLLETLKQDEIYVLILLFEGVMADHPQGLYGIRSLLEGPRIETKPSESSSSQTDLLSCRNAMANVITFRTIASSLEPLFTRRLFPCFDSLHFKTRFSLAVSIPVIQSEKSFLPPIQVISSTPVRSNLVTQFPPLFPSVKRLINPSLAYLSETLTSFILFPNPLTRTLSEKLPISKSHRQWSAKGCLTCCSRSVVRFPLSPPKCELMTTDFRSMSPIRKKQKHEATVVAQLTSDNPTIQLASSKFFSLQSSVLQLLFAPNKGGTFSCTSSSADHKHLVSITKGSPHRFCSRMGQSDSRDEIQFPKDTPDSLANPSFLHGVDLTKISDHQISTVESINNEHEPFSTYLFETTPSLPCYALGLFIGHFVITSIQSMSKGITGTVTSSVEVHTEADQNRKFFKTNSPMNEDNKRSEVTLSCLCVPYRNLDGCEFSLWIGSNCLQILEQKWPSVTYPTNKLDIIPLPQHRGLGLENFGCISIDDRYFFVDEMTQRRRGFRISRLICHEISHMWLGDLISPSSFDELWLKEGLARYVEYCILLEIYATSDKSSSKITTTMLSSLLNRYSFSSNDVWGSFVLEVFWDALVADSQDLSSLPQTRSVRQGSDLQKLIRKFKPPDGPQSVSGLVVKGEGVKFHVSTTLSPSLSPSNIPSDEEHSENHNSLELRNVFSKAECSGSLHTSPPGSPHHAVRLKGLLKTQEITEKFDSITYGKAACILHSLAEFVGGREVFFEIIHRLLQSKCPKIRDNISVMNIQELLSEASGLITPEDLWKSVASEWECRIIQRKECELSRELPAKNTFDYAVMSGSPRVSADLIEALFDPWLTRCGFPRVAVRLDHLRAQVSNESQLVFVMSLNFYQLLLPKEESAPQKLAITIPMRIEVEGQEVVFLLDSDCVTIPIYRKSEDVVAGKAEGSVSVVSLLPIVVFDRILCLLFFVKPESSFFGCIFLSEKKLLLCQLVNYNFGSFCTFHPQNQITWDALLNAVRSVNHQTMQTSKNRQPHRVENDCDLSLLLITILEDTRYQLNESYFLQRRTKPIKENTLAETTLTRLFELYTAMSERLLNGRNRMFQEADEDENAVFIKMQQPLNKNNLFDCRPIWPLSYTFLTVLHIILAVFDYVIRTVPRTPPMNKMLSKIVHMIEIWMSELIYPECLLIICREWLQVDQNISSNRIYALSMEKIQTTHMINKPNRHSVTPQNGTLGFPINTRLETIGVSSIHHSPESISSNSVQFTSGNSLFKLMKELAIAPPNCIMFSRSVINSVIEIHF